MAWGQLDCSAQGRCPGVPGFLCLAVTLCKVLGGLSFPVCRQWPWAAMVLEVVSHKLHLIMADNIRVSTVMTKPATK